MAREATVPFEHGARVDRKARPHRALIRSRSCRVMISQENELNPPQRALGFTKSIDVTGTDMPTGEFKKLLDRDFAKVSVEPLTEITSPLLREFVDAALMAFRRCEVEAADKGKENEDVTALILFRQIIEMADGIELLVAHNCGTAAKTGFHIGRRRDTESGPRPLP